jgi:P4 family phage/plasmid primase-like protien
MPDANDYVFTENGKWMRKDHLDNEDSHNKDAGPALVQTASSKSPSVTRFMTVSVQVNHLAVAQELKQQYHFATMKDTQEIYVYQNGVYVPDGITFIQGKARDLLGEYFSTHRVQEIINEIKYSTFTDRDRFDVDKRMINLENGLLNTETMEIEPHSPDYLSLVRIPVNYSFEAQCPQIEEFLQEILLEEDIPLVQEMCGYCLFPEYRFHKAFMLQGSGRNGKSTLLNLLQRFLGNKNCSNVDLSALCNERFTSSQLFGKLANIFSDLPAEAIKNTGIFKALVGGDRINAEKKFQNSFDFTNYAKLIFSCNYVPVTSDLSPAFFARWIIVRFPHSFEGSKMNPNLLRKLTTEDELSGLLNLALYGLKRLLSCSGFSYNKSPEEVAEEYQRLSNPVSAFIADCIQEEPESRCIKDELYNAFKSYCKQNGYPVYSERKFVDGLKREVSISECRPSVNGQQKRAWQGIRLLPSTSCSNSQDSHDIHDFFYLRNNSEKRE